MPRQINGLVDTIQSFGLQVVEHDGWQKRGQTGFDPKGVVCHHTAISSTTASIRICIEGRPDLPGPLCQLVLDPGGVIHLIAAGKANHAGTGSYRKLKGNSRVWGIEAVHSGKASDIWPMAQFRAFHTLCAALCKYSRIDPKYVCGHKEWTSRKIDPIAIDMDNFRNLVYASLNGQLQFQQPTQPSPPQQITPGYNPMLVLEPIADDIFWNGGHYLVAGSGAIYAFNAPGIRGPNGKDYWADRQVARVYAGDSTDPEIPEYINRDGRGLIIRSTNNQWYGPYLPE